MRITLYILLSFIIVYCGDNPTVEAQRARSSSQKVRWIDLQKAVQDSINNSFSVYNVNIVGNAQGDSVNIDTEEIQETIDAATSGATVFFPNSSYIIDSVIVIDKDLTVIGNNSSLIANDTTFTLLDIKASSVTIRGMNFKSQPGARNDYDVSLATAPHGIRLTQPTSGTGTRENITIENCNIVGFPSAMRFVFLNTTSNWNLGDVTLKNVRTDSCWYAVQYGYGVAEDSRTAGNLIIENCDFNGGQVGNVSSKGISTQNAYGKATLNEITGFGMLGEHFNNKVNALDDVDRDFYSVDLNFVYDANPRLAGPISGARIVTNNVWDGNLWPVGRAGFPSFPIWGIEAMDHGQYIGNIFMNRPANGTSIWIETADVQISNCQFLSDTVSNQIYGHITVVNRDSVDTNKNIAFHADNLKIDNCIFDSVYVAVSTISTPATTGTPRRARNFNFTNNTVRNSQQAALTLANFEGVNISNNDFTNAFRDSTSSLSQQSAISLADSCDKVTISENHFENTTAGTGMSYGVTVFNNGNQNSFIGLTNNILTEMLDGTKLIPSADSMVVYHLGNYVNNVGFEVPLERNSNLTVTPGHQHEVHGVSYSGNITYTLLPSHHYTQELTFMKVDAGATDTLFIDPAGAETINGLAQDTLVTQYSSIKIIPISGGGGWRKR